MATTIDLTKLSPTQSHAKAQHQDAVDLIQMIRDLPVETQDDIEFAAESLAEIKGDRERFKGMLDSVAGPIEESLKTLKSWFKPGLDAFDQAEKVLKEKIKIAYESSFQRQREALKEAAEHSIAGDEDAADAAMDRANDYELQPVKGLQLRNAWDFEVEDWSKIPDEYKIVDEKKVIAVIRAHKGKTHIPGIKPIRKTGVASGKR